MHKKNLGFTLLELLVVIAIIGLLIAAGATSYGAVKKKGRDSTRKSDLRNLQKSLELYKQCHRPPSFYSGSLPAPGSLGAQVAGDPNATCPAGTVYINRVPGDPATGASYSYVPVPSGCRESGPPCTGYTLCACLESAQDPDPAASAGSCPTTTCVSGRRYQIVEQ